MFIQAIIGHTSDAKALREQLEVWAHDLAPQAEGWEGTTAGVTDDDQFVAVVRFSSEEAARRNSDRSDQGAWWSDTERLFDKPVEFHDYPDVDTMLAGGSDDAGFVQVIHGRTSDLARLKEVADTMDQHLGGFRSDVIGGTYAWRDDSDLLEAVYFTSEEEAREGERRLQDAPKELRDAFQEYLSLRSDLRYFDLREPWFWSAR